MEENLEMESKNITNERSHIKRFQNKRYEKSYYCNIVEL